MIDVAPSTEVEVVLKVNLGDDVALVGGCGLRGKCCVQNIDICLMVLCMVQRHDLSTDVWFECLYEL